VQEADLIRAVHENGFEEHIVRAYGLVRKRIDQGPVTATNAPNGRFPVIHSNAAGLTLCATDINNQDTISGRIVLFRLDYNRLLLERLSGGSLLSALQPFHKVITL
jgi:hypothetical protein